MIKTTEKDLRRMVREEYSRIQEDTMDDRTYTISKPADGELGQMGIDPYDMKTSLLQQFEFTARALVNFLKQVRTMKEMSAELSDMEAEGFVDGDFGTKMLDGLRELNADARQLAQTWNSLDDIS